MGLLIGHIVCHPIVGATSSSRGVAPVQPHLGAPVRNKGGISEHYIVIKGNESVVSRPANNFTNYQ